MGKARSCKTHVDPTKIQLKVTDEFLWDRIQSVHHAAVDVYELDLFISRKDRGRSAVA